MTPPGETLHNEPAKVIGDQFADKTTIVGVLAAVVALLVGLGVKIPDGIDAAWIDNAAYVIAVVATVVTTLVARINAHRQAAKTREHVYSPETIEQVVPAVASAVKSGADVVVVPPPPADGAKVDAWVARTV